MAGIKADKIEIYRDGDTVVEATLEGDTVWLTTEQMAELYDSTARNIRQHISNILDDGELDGMEVASTEEPAADAISQRPIPIYNLDMIISVGYRVNSKRGVQFRRWASNVLKGYMIEGAVVNHQRLAELRGAQLDDARRLISMASTAIRHAALHGEKDHSGVADLLAEYGESLTILSGFDDGRLQMPVGMPSKAPLSAESAMEDVTFLREALSARGEVGPSFGVPRDDGIEGILRSIESSMFGEDLYRSAEEKAANLFYFIIKDHPFVDGNKRIASFMLVRYLAEQGSFAALSPEALAPMAIMTAGSRAEDKDLIIRLVAQTLSKDPPRLERTLDAEGQTMLAQARREIEEEAVRSVMRRPGAPGLTDWQDAIDLLE